MKKILVATEKPFAKIAVEGIREVVENAGYECLLLEKYTSKDEFLNAIKNVNALIIRSDFADKAIIDFADHLEIIVRAGAGYDNIDLKAASEKNIVAMNTPGQNSNAVAELALGMMVMLARNNYSGSAGTELCGKKLGIHAYGNVGKLVAKIAKGFGMEVFAFDPFVDADTIESDGVKVLTTAADLYKTCQYISLHIPANDKTKASINYELLMSMPQGASLINTARKEVICETDLLKVMEERKDFKYASDVAPDCLPNLIENFAGRFFVTPKKIGAQTQEANINAGIAAAEQIVDFFKTGNTRFKVN